jgi:hypothetical protein
MYFRRIYLLFFAVIISSIHVFYSSKYFLIHDFECRGRITTRNLGGDCNRSSVADIFLSMYSKGNGYLLASGSWSCENTEEHPIDGIQNFTFNKEGEYYSMRFKDSKTHMELLNYTLRYHTLKLKITRLNSGDFLLRLPTENLMVCTRS